MNRNEQIEQRLRSVEAPEAPASLGPRLRAGIPDDLASLTSARRTSGPRWWQAAAAVILLLGGGILGWIATHDSAAPTFEVGQRARATARPVESPRTVAESAPSRPEPAIARPGAPELLPGPARPVTLDGVAPRNEADTVTNAQTFAGVAVTRKEMEHDAMATAQGESVAISSAPEARPLPYKGVVGGVIAQEGSAMSRSKMVASPAPPPPSTGGTAEPNDQPYGDVFFKTYGTNPFIDTEDDTLSTFGLDVDTGSWGVAKRYLSDGHLPPAEAIRVEEILNAFRYGDRAPARDDFAIYSDAAPWPFPRGERYHALRFGIRSRQVSAANRKPATLIFTVDVSGSMAREDRLELVKRALALLIDQLDERDRIGLVVYGTNGEVLLEPTGDHEAIRHAIERLTPAGSTNAEEGLTLAYRLAGRYYRRGEINRVILCSDGVANVGRTGPESILESIGEWARRGIELTTVGFGMGNYNDVLMEQLADRGNGQYAYVDSLAEARKVFVENLTATLQTIAHDAKVQVEFEPSAVARYRLIGYENRDIADERFRDDTVDAGEIGAGHSVTALYEIKLQPNAPRNARIATLRLRYKDVDDGDRVREIEHPVYARDIEEEWTEAPASLRLATMAATFGEMLKRSYWVKDLDPALVARRLGTLANEMNDPEVDELAAMARIAARLAKTP